MEFPAAPVDNTFRGGERRQPSFDTDPATQTATTEEAEQLQHSNRRRQLNSELPTQIPASIDPTLEDPPPLEATWTPDDIARTALTPPKNADCNEDQLNIVTVSTSALCRTQTGDGSDQ